jgi:hypothetical protein
MAHGGITEASAFSIPAGPATSIGVEGEMARVSIASLLEGAGPAVVATPDTGGANHVVGQHGMIMDLYSSASLSSVTLDFGLAVPGLASANDPIRHEIAGILSGGAVHVPLAELLQGELGVGGASLGFAGEQRIPDDLHAMIASQVGIAGFDVPRGADGFSVVDGLELGHHEIAAFLSGNGLPAPISEQHFIA